MDLLIVAIYYGVIYGGGALLVVAAIGLLIKGFDDWAYYRERERERYERDRAAGGW